MSNWKLVFFKRYILLLIFLLGMGFLCPVVTSGSKKIENDFIRDLLDMDIFEPGSKKIKKEIYDEINEIHFSFSICKVCIKIIQIFNKIIDGTKEKYIDVAIEEALEMNVCDSKIWNEYFHFNEIIYNEYILYYCDYTMKRIKNDIEEHIYELYKNEKLFIKTVCEKLYTVCDVAIKQEEAEKEYENENNNRNKNKNENENINENTHNNYVSRTKLIFDVYADYVVKEKQFKRTNKGLPYKIIGDTPPGRREIEKDDYILIQSKIKELHKNILLNDFKYNIYRLIKVEELDDKIQELFFLVKEQDQLDFFFFHEFCKNEKFPSNSLFEGKVKIHKVLKNASEIENEVEIKDNEKLIINNEDFIFTKNSCF